ncbi:MAG: hypothetical protein IPL51_06325 [Candidatus Competibacteraceae bacterium]|nr:hypothetical protein [Candidatus Competibacteraceae bacterium]
MYIVDDPTLALMIRFMGDTESLNLSDADFLFKQLDAIEQYVSQYPADERQARALEWIETYARDYRQRWQQQAAAREVARLRCSDCPLAEGKPDAPCPVHRRWLSLLRRYADGDLSGQDYVRDAMKLLHAHKKRLKISRLSPSFSKAPTELAPG